MKLLNLVLTGPSEPIYFGAPADKMDPLLRTASIGVVLFLAGYFLQPPKES